MSEQISSNIKDGYTRLAQFVGEEAKIKVSVNNALLLLESILYGSKSIVLLILFAGKF